MKIRSPKKPEEKQQQQHSIDYNTGVRGDEIIRGRKDYSASSFCLFFSTQTISDLGYAHPHWRSQTILLSLSISVLT